MQNRVRNFKMAESNKNTLADSQETEMWRTLRPIKTPMVYPRNEFTVDGPPKVPDEI